jgi:Na+-driven multidrug efflux pump
MQRERQERLFRKVFVGFVIAIAVTMAAFPPWVYMMRTMGTPPDDYAWFIQPPAKRLSEQKRVNIEQLVRQYVILAGFTAVALFVMRERKRN